MGLSNFPSAAEGMLPVLVMNTVSLVALLKNILRSVVQVMGAIGNSNLEGDPDEYPQENAREERVSTTQFKYLCGGGGWVECCVCLCRFGAEEEVSELPCKHFFHKVCLDKWFDNKNSTCPLCRSIH